jgi:5-formyltetrahydrofolate cyclo-ligase
VALYAPMLAAGEVDVRPLDALARAAGKAVYYPFLERGAGGRGFRRVDDPAALAFRGQRFAEPDPGWVEARPGDIDLFVVPALAAAVDGHRLGQGAGFYDALLGAYCPPARALVVVYDFQVRTELPVDDWDRACELVVTETRAIATVPPPAVG